jgi:hypothetical protein
VYVKPVCAPWGAVWLLTFAQQITYEKRPELSVDGFQASVTL